MCWRAVVLRRGALHEQSLRGSTRMHARTACPCIEVLRKGLAGARRRSHERRIFTDALRSFLAGGARAKWRYHSIGSARTQCEQGDSAGRPARRCSTMLDDARRCATMLDDGARTPRLPAAVSMPVRRRFRRRCWRRRLVPRLRRRPCVACSSLRLPRAPKSIRTGDRAVGFCCRPGAGRLAFERPREARRFRLAAARRGSEPPRVSRAAL